MFIFIRVHQCLPCRMRRSALGCCAASRKSSLASFCVELHEIFRQFRDALICSADPRSSGTRAAAAISQNQTGGDPGAPQRSKLVRLRASPQMVPISIHGKSTISTVANIAAKEGLRRKILPQTLPHAGGSAERWESRQVAIRRIGLRRTWPDFLRHLPQNPALKKLLASKISLDRCGYSDAFTLDKAP
jgi:hypothetical protein